MPDKKYYEAQKKAVKKYYEKLDRIGLTLPKGKRDVYRAAAEQEGRSLNAFVINCVEEHLQHVQDHDSDTEASSVQR